MSIINSCSIINVRDNVRDALLQIEEAFNKGSSVVVCVAPTGSGKSIISSTAAKHFKTAHIIVPQNMLIDQYEKDFSFSGIKGKSFYPCYYGDTCDKSDCWNEPKKETINDCRNNEYCQYLMKREKALSSDISVFNFIGAICFSGINFSMHKNFEKKEILIVDEAHSFESYIRNYYSITLSKKILKAHKDIFPRDSKGHLKKFETKELFFLFYNEKLRALLYKDMMSLREGTKYEGMEKIEVNDDIN